MIWQIIGAFIAVVAASILLEAPKKFIYRAGFIGAMGWSVYLIFLNLFGSVIATYFAGLVISSLSHIFSRIFKTPVTIFFIPGFYPLVPGYKMYLAVYNFISGDVTLAQTYLIDTIKISGVIALAIFTIDTVFKVVNQIEHKVIQD